MFNMCEMQQKAIPAARHTVPANQSGLVAFVAFLAMLFTQMQAQNSSLFCIENRSEPLKTKGDSIADWSQY